MNKFKTTAGTMLLGLLLLGSGCSTMKVTEFKTESAASYALHQEREGLLVAVKPLLDAKAVREVFKVNLLEKGLVPVLVVAENRSSAGSFQLLKEGIAVLNETGESAGTVERKGVASGKVGTGFATVGAAVGSAPLLIAGLKMASNASVIQHNLAAKEFYSRTLGPGQTARGYVYFQFAGDNPPAGALRVVVQARNSATGTTTAFDFPTQLTVSK